MDSYAYMGIVLLGIAVVVLFRSARQRSTDDQPAYAPGSPKDHRRAHDEDLASLGRRRDDGVGGES